MALASVDAARAQIAPFPTTASEDTISVLAPVPHQAKNPLLKPSRENTGFTAGDWTIAPFVVAGVGYDDNLVWSSSNPVRTAGLRVSPNVVATREADGHKTTVYGGADVNIYPGLGEADTLAGEVGVAHKWEATSDLVISGKAQYDHGAADIGGGVVSTPFSNKTMVSPLIYDRGDATIAVKKIFGRAFVGLTVDSTVTNYSPAKTTTGYISQSYRDSWVNAVTARGGVWVSPAVYAFAEVSGNLKNYSDGSYTSKGYRAVAGVGSDRVSLFRGEVFAGVQEQFYDQQQVENAATPVFGGKLYWYPTRDLTFRATLDESFSDSSLPTPGNPNGYPSRTTAVQLAMNYQFARDLSGSLRGGYAHSNYIGSTRTDDTWTASVGMLYAIYRNVDLMIGYDFAKGLSTDSTGKYRRNAVNVSVKYKY